MKNRIYNRAHTSGLYVLYVNWNRIFLQTKFHKCHLALDMHSSSYICTVPMITVVPTATHTAYSLIRRCTPMQYCGYVCYT